MALKQFYSNEADIPTEVKSFYAQKGNVFELQIEGVNSISAVLTKNSELLGQHTNDKAEITRLTGEVSRLTTEIDNAQTLPANHVPVPKADAKYVELKSLGSVDEIKGKVTEHGTLKTAQEAVTREKHLREVAKVLGYNEDAFVMLSDLPEFDIRDATENGKPKLGKDGKPVKTAIAKIKGEGDAITEKSGADFIQEKYSPFLPSLKTTSSGTKYIAQDAGGNAPTTSSVDKYLDTTYKPPKRKEATA